MHPRMRPEPANENRLESMFQSMRPNSAPVRSTAAGAASRVRWGRLAMRKQKRCAGDALAMCGQGWLLRAPRAPRAPAWAPFVMPALPQGAVKSRRVRLATGQVRMSSDDRIRIRQAGRIAGRAGGQARSGAGVAVTSPLCRQTTCCCVSQPWMIAVPSLDRDLSSVARQARLGRGSSAPRGTALSPPAIGRHR